MPLVRYQVSIPAVSTVSEDTVTNTWHFTMTDLNETNSNAVQTALVAFYENIDSFKGDLQNWASARVKMYDMSEPEPRVPYSDELLGTSSAPSGTSLPHEVAACVSFNGAYVSGFSQARRRGRIFLGPLNTTCFTDSTGYLSASFLSTTASGAGALLTASNSASDWAWVVYSPTGATSYPVVAGWVDNAVDIQRSRGFKATTRTTF